MAMYDDPQSLQPLLAMSRADMAADRDFAGSVLWQLPGVRETRTYAVIEEIKSSTRLPL